MLPWLSIWLLVTGAAGLFSSLQGFFKPGFLSKSMYPNVPQMPHVFERLFATWTLVTTAVRCTCALYLEGNPQLYFVCLCTYVAALLHFSLETFVFKTVSVAKGMMPFVIASVSLVWMLSEYEQNTLML